MYAKGVTIESPKRGKALSMVLRPFHVPLPPQLKDLEERRVRSINIVPSGYDHQKEKLDVVHRLR